MTMCMRLDMMRNHRGGGLITIIDDFETQQANDWAYTSSTPGLQAYLNDSQLALFSADQMRFDVNQGVIVESNRTNVIPSNVTYADWTKVGGSLATIPDSLVSNQNVARFTSDLTNGLHTFYIDSIVSDMKVSSFYIFFESNVAAVRLESQAHNFTLNSDGSSDQPNFVKSKILSNGWVKFTIKLPSSGAPLFAIYLLGEGNLVSWQPSVPAIIRFFGVIGESDPVDHTYFPVPGTVAAIGAKGILQKPPYVGFDGNNFELIVEFRPFFGSADSSILPNMSVFEFGVVGVDQIKLYYSASSNQFTFDRYANGQSSFVQCAQTSFKAGDVLTLVVAQKVGQGIGISINGATAQSASANAKLAGALPTGNMFLGCDVSGDGQINSSIKYIKFIKL